MFYNTFFNEVLGLFIFIFKGSLLSLYIKSNPPTFFSLLLEVMLSYLSSFQLLGITIFNKSFITCFFIKKSFFVVATILGDALTSINQGFIFLSINISNPYNSKQCLSFNITFYTAFNVLKYTLSISYSNFSFTSLP